MVVHTFQALWQQSICLLDIHASLSALCSTGVCHSGYCKTLGMCDNACQGQGNHLIHKQLKSHVLVLVQGSCNALRGIIQGWRKVPARSRKGISSWMYVYVCRALYMIDNSGSETRHETAWLEFHLSFSWNCLTRVSPLFFMKLLDSSFASLFHETAWLEFRLSFFRFGASLQFAT